MNNTTTMTPNAAHSQVLTLLAELSNKLDPMPAPKPETVSLCEVQQRMHFLPEFGELNEALCNLEKVAHDIHIEIACRVKRLAHSAPASNAAAWQYVLEHRLKDLRLACDEISLPALRYSNHVRHLTCLLVLAADGTIDDLETGGHHE